MRHNGTRFYALAILLAFGGVQTIGASETAHLTRSAIKAIGSVPPGDQFFSCVSELNGKPFSKQAAEVCLTTIKKLSFVQDAKLQKSDLDDGRILLVFAIRSQSLPIKELNIDCVPAEKKELEAWLRVSPGTLRVGAPFSRDEETVTYQAIRAFYLSRGRLVGAVPTVDLRFSDGVSIVKFQIVYGPEIRPEPQLPPHGPNCDEPIVNVDWSNTDKYVPFELVNSAVSLSTPVACYTKDAAQHDQAAIDSLGILHASKIDYKKQGHGQSVSYKLVGKPITIADVSFKIFGDANTCSESSWKQLQLKTGEIYIRENADQSAKNLERACSREGFWTEIKEVDMVTNDGKLHVTFNVISFPLQKVIVDGIAAENSK